MQPVFPAAPTPRVLWVELTSKCPYDCIFCSRKLRRGAGAHLPLACFEGLIRELVDPRTIVLNYSGESTCYPDLMPAIRLARDAGAWVELVSVLPREMPELATSGLNRLTVSFHTLNSAQYAGIYGLGSLETHMSRLARFVALPGRPVVDVGFVAMERNIDQLPAVAGFAAGLGIGDLLVFPVMRRDDIAETFFAELDSAAFRSRVVEQAAAARRTGVRVQICNPAFTSSPAELGRNPIPFPGPLPPGARIHNCEQNPFETAHVLSNGDVVACEVLDRYCLGNLFEQPLRQIWTGEPYREMRRRYTAGEIPECRGCPWKVAYVPGDPQSEIVAMHGENSQLLSGWHSAEGGQHIWSTQRSCAVLKPRRESGSLHVSGLLPPGFPGSPNELIMVANGRPIGRVENPWEEMIPFGMDFPVDAADGEWHLEFRTRHVFRPAERSMGSDNRDLGFAMVLLASKRARRPDRELRHMSMLGPLRRWIERADRIGQRVPKRVQPADAGRFRPGISVIVPERSNPPELAACLASLDGAAAGIGEPVQVIVAVNGTPAHQYTTLRARYPTFDWHFSNRSLGFNGAVRMGLARAHFDWVYLLNSDVILEAGSLKPLLALRGPGVFAVASQIFLKDKTRYREETNWTELSIENGLVEIRDRVPEDGAAPDCSYGGGGASMFNRRWLQRLAASTEIYSPFYWEDVEWGWRARRLGFRVLFCPESVAHHAHRATVGRLYTAEQIEDVFERNRLLFQLRNLTSQDLLDPAFQTLARLPDISFFLRRRTAWEIAKARLWNHRV